MKAKISLLSGFFLLLVSIVEAEGVDYNISCHPWKHKYETPSSKIEMWYDSFTEEIIIKIEGRPCEIEIVKDGIPFVIKEVPNVELNNAINRFPICGTGDYEVSLLDEKKCVLFRDILHIEEEG